MKATVHTSATVRDITAIAKRLLKDTPASDYKAVSQGRLFLLQLGQEAAKVSVRRITSVIAP
jgi:hypothetical protein